MKLSLFSPSHLSGTGKPYKGKPKTCSESMTFNLFYTLIYGLKSTHLKLSIVLLLSIFSITPLTFSQITASMVKDIWPGSGHSLPSLLTNVNGTLFFVADDGTNGKELWKSDGTIAGTVLVKDIRTGSLSSNPEYLTNVNGTLFFTADDGTNGKELWKSDGTAAGTVMVKNILTGSLSSSPEYLTSVNGTLFFAADNLTNGRELWKSDGTTAGTVMVKDISPGYSPSYPHKLTNVNGTLFFRANDGTHGYELWKSDGTIAGTVLVKDIWPGAGHSFPGFLTDVNGILFFSAIDETNGIELWKSDGTTAGTVMVKDIWPGLSSSYPNELTNVNGTLFFSARDISNGQELWKSDGTAAGTVIVKDIWPGSLGSVLEYLTNVDGTLFFAAGDFTNGKELWKSDGTTAGTVMVKDIWPGLPSSHLNELTNVNGTLFFAADNLTNGKELWKSDGTTAGTVMVKDISPGYTNSYPSSLTNVNGTLFFAAGDFTNGRELWKTEPIACPDSDGDGYIDATCGGNDCNDSDPSIHPGATEICDGIDNDCDGLVDAADPDLVDITPPIASCQDFTTNLDPSGSYTLDPASIDDGSSDNCGIASMSVSVSTFFCSHIGVNTVTLTVSDATGNTATCSANVTINPFVVINSISTTAESCAGQGDGSITIDATAPGGTLMYSINGGGSFQGSNVFNNVSPGTYSVMVQAQGTGCQTSGSATVGAGPAPTTWYKDIDGDGYTDGITTLACTMPAGFVASALPGDCNDNNASINPGAPELCNGLDDNCDGIIPANEQDNDADGFRVCDGDCDDADPDINPGATEICNNIDDDCDGLIDEGVAFGTEVFVGSVNLTSQAAVDNFSQCYYKIQGNLTIIGLGINSLANLSYLEEVTGNVLIQVTSLPNLNGLEALDMIGGSLTIKLNNYGARLSSLDGLQNLSTIGNNLNISFNFSLGDCCSIDDLLSGAGVGGTVTIFNNAMGCNSTGDIATSCSGMPIIVQNNDGISFGEPVAKPRMSIFPNPASNTVTVLLEGLGQQPGTLTISDQLGRTVLIQKLQAGQEVLDLDLAKHGMNTGVYQVTVTTETQRLVKRLMVNR